MTSLITLPNDHFAVTVPEGAKKFQVSPTGWIVGYLTLIRPPEIGSYTIVALGSEITEEQAGEIVPPLHTPPHGVAGWAGGSTQSSLNRLLSLLASLSLEASTTLIIKQNK